MTPSPRGPGLGCRKCGETLALGAAFGGCPVCAGGDTPLEVFYDYDRHRENATLDRWRGKPAGVWTYRELLPLPEGAGAISLGEGGTPLLRLETPGPGVLWLKDETRNPTGAFKDRFHTVSVSMARHLGFAKVTSSTTGNHGTSLSAYAARAGLRCLVFADTRAPAVQTDLMALFGAHVVAIDERRDLLAWLVHERGWYPSTGLVPWPVGTPFGVEGYKTIAFEVYFQLGGVMPQRVICPTAVGDVLYGPWRGFVELSRLGAEGTLPRMFAAQAEGCDPIVQAFREGMKTVPVHPAPNSVALSIGDETAAPYALEAIYDSGGGALAVSDEALYEAMRLLGRNGIAAEPSSAASVAAALALQSRGDIAADEQVVCLVTGAAAKWPGPLAAAARHRMLRHGDQDAIRAWITAFDD